MSMEHNNGGIYSVQDKVERGKFVIRSLSEHELDKRTLQTALLNNSKSLQDFKDFSTEPVDRQKLLGSRVIKMEEIAPKQSTILAQNEDGQPMWMQKLNSFSSQRQGTDKNLPRSIRRYYKQQNELIKAFEDTQCDVQESNEGENAADKMRRQANLLAKISFFCNLVLLVGKAVAAVLSGSLSVITSVIDSAVDLVSGILMWCSGRAVKQKDTYRYPQGRTKLEPVAIVVLSVIMALASFQVILQSLLKIVDFAVYDVKPHGSFNVSEVFCVSIQNMSAYVEEPSPLGPVFELDSIIICVVTIDGLYQLQWERGLYWGIADLYNKSSITLTKLVLFLVCRRVPVPSSQALAQDHRNDVISNTAAVACGIIGYKLWKYADALGAIIIGVYIIISWFITGWQQIKMLTGHTARPDFLKRITWIALNHHPNITHIDTVRAFHFGNNFLVEIDIVLPEDMNLRVAHDIGETLQAKIERLDDVERAFVHVDYETLHHPTVEHKVV